MFKLMSLHKNTVNTISVNSASKFLILVVLALTPLFNLFEVFALVNHTLTSPMYVLTPIYIKLIKDVFLLMIICLGTFKVLLCRRVLAEPSFWLFVFSVQLSLCLSIFNQDFLLTLAGVRYLLPFAVLFSVYGIIDNEFQQKLAKLLIILLVVGLIMQAHQLFCLGDHYGLNFLGLSRRNPGFYLIPSSMAMFSLMTMYYVYHYYPDGVLRNLFVYILGPLSVLLTGSGTGIVSLGLFVLTIAYFRTRPKWIMFLVCISIMLLILLFLPKLTGRHDIYVSLSMRLQKLSNALRHDCQLLSNHFGYGTNTACLLMLHLGKGASKIFIADSTPISMIVSFGFLPLMFLVLFVARTVGKHMIHIHFIAIFGSFMLTTIIFELFPANLLFSVNMAYFLKNKYNQILCPTSICVNTSGRERANNQK